jgi:cytoskeletal protein CcmA (bactofilin family)
MFQSSDSPKSNTPAHNANAYTSSTVSIPVEQATIGRTLVFKGEISGSESLYIDGCVEGKINLPQSRVTIGRNGKAAANIQALEVVVMGTVTGNIDCGDRVEIRSEGSVAGDISTVRISVEDGASIKGGIHVKSEGKASGTQNKQEQAKATAGA